MSRTRSLILLCSLLGVLAGCGYSFVLAGGGNLGKVNLSATVNKTRLTAAGMELDSQLENELSIMGAFERNADLPRLSCTILNAASREITANVQAENRFRLILSVRAEIKDTEGKLLWQQAFTDDGVYASGGQEENALEEACGKIASRIAQAVIAISIEK